MKEKNKPKKRFNKLLAVVLLLVAVILLVTALRFFRWNSLQIQTASYETFTIAADCQGLVIRSERLLTAPTAGYFIPSVQEGSKVAAGAAVGFLAETPDSQTGTAVTSGAYSGVVSYQLDGWENLLSAAALADSDRLALIQAYQDGSVEANAAAEVDSTVAGRTVAKIVDNLEGYHILAWLETPPHPYVSNNQVSLIYNTDRGESRQLTVDVEENGMLADGRYYLLLNAPDSAVELLFARSLTCSLLGASVSGVAVPASALVENAAGETGVWLAVNDRLTFTPVEISGQNGDHYLTNDIKEGVEVATNPARAREGLKRYHR